MNFLITVLFLSVMLYIPFLIILYFIINNVLLYFYPRFLFKIKNPNKKLLLHILHNYWHYFEKDELKKYLKNINIDEDFQKQLLLKSTYFINILEPSVNIIKFLCNYNIESIRYIEHIPEDIQHYILDNFGIVSISLIKNTFYSTEKKVINYDSHYITLIVNPKFDIIIETVKINSKIIYLMKNYSFTKEVQFAILPYIEQAEINFLEKYNILLPEVKERWNKICIMKKACE